MSKTNEKITNYILAPDCIIKDHGPIAALIYGAVWRLCHMRYKKSIASQTKIGDYAGVTRFTAGKWLKVLVDHDWLEEVTPEDVASTSREKHYDVTGKWQLIEKEKRIETEPVENFNKQTTEPDNTCELFQQEPVENFNIEEESFKNSSLNTLSNTNVLDSDPSVPDVPDPTDFTKTELEDLSFTKTQYEQMLALETEQTKPRKTVIAHFELKLEFFSFSDAYQTYCREMGITGNHYRRTPGGQSGSFHKDDDRALFDVVTDLEFFKQVLQGWRRKGYKERNIEGILECYKSRRLPNGNGKGGYQRKSNEYQPDNNHVHTPDQRAEQVKLIPSFGS